MPLLTFLASSLLLLVLLALTALAFCPVGGLWSPKHLQKLKRKDVGMHACGSSDWAALQVRYQLCLRADDMSAKVDTAKQGHEQIVSVELLCNSTRTWTACDLSSILSVNQTKSTCQIDVPFDVCHL